MKRKPSKNKESDGDYSVVRFENNGNKMFECVWDGWFVDENQNSCFWPPTTGKSYLLRVLSKQAPEDSWKIHRCTVISRGHVTYKSGFDEVKRKCEQKYNTSSADEQQAAANFRRKHPVLSTETESFEHIFTEGKSSAKQKPKKKARQPQKKIVKEKKRSNNEPMIVKNVSKKIHSEISPQRCSPTRPTSPLSLISDRNYRSQRIEDFVESASRSVNSDFHCTSEGSRSPISSRSVLSGTRSRSRSSIRQRASIDSKSHSESGSGYSRKSRSISRNSNERSQSSRHSFRSISRSRSASPEKENVATKSSPATLHLMDLQLKELRIIAKQNFARISAMERRLSRMEVTVNKVLVTVTDLKHAINLSNGASSGNTEAQAKTNEVPKGFKEPNFPIKSILELINLNRNLRDGDFRTFLLSQETYYCTASRQSNSVVMTAYLKRFMSLGLRDEIHLKDSKGKDDNPILMRDFREIYKLLIDVMVKGYAMSKTLLKSSDAHIALRTVWGRTKQMIREQGL